MIVWPMRTTCWALVLLSLAACSDEPSGPARPEPSVPVRLCTSLPWVAFRNEGAGWQRSVADAGGVHTFLATERLVLATALLDTVFPALFVEHLTAEQVNAGYACPEDPAPMSGTVGVVMRGIGAGGNANVSYAGQQATLVSAPDSAREVATWPGEHDLVAMRNPPSNGIADRIILRRGQAYSAGSSVVLDFASDEAFAPATHALRWSGPAAYALVSFFTARGNENFTQSTTVGEFGSADQPRSTTMHGVPASRLLPGDLHRLRLFAFDREVVLWYREPRDLDVEFGPLPSAPVFTTEATSPYVRLRVEVPAQPEYDARVSINVQQDVQMPGVNRATTVWMVATREYFGATPSTWSMTMPDLRGVAGFDIRVGLAPGPMRWLQTVSSQPLLFRQAMATEGLVHRTAHATGNRP
jgi:hypothetical protein